MNVITSTVSSISHAILLLLHGNKRSLLITFSIFLIFGTANSNAIPFPSHFSKISRTSLNADFQPSVHSSLAQAISARAAAFNLTLSRHKPFTVSAGSPVVDCLELLDDTIDQLTNVVDGRTDHIAVSPNDVLTWLSAALTNQETCVESLRSYNSEVERGVLESTSRNLSRSISESLALYATRAEPTRGGGRRLLKNDGFPKWVSASERLLLEAPVEELVAHAVVAKDGSGTHGTIREAVASLAAGGDGRTVIYVKAGTYHEYLKIPTKQKNVMLVGDGKGKTVIVGDRNSEEGSTTFQSATVGAMGDGFIARDITFVNSAGPSKHQAVALRVGADKAVIYRCSAVGYQDTLYAYSKRQFYRETDIYGTVDFIFGNAAAVFQSCGIFPRKPLNADNFITAQGRTSPYQNTGFSIHNCRISAADDLAPAKSKIRTFLGRPWKQYSRTVIMQSFMDDSIHPSGWSPWSGGFALKTLYYGEYLNSGPGAATSGRVNWPGYHPAMSPREAEGFTVAGFIDGNMWLPATGVSFDSGLIG